PLIAEMGVGPRGNRRRVLRKRRAEALKASYPRGWHPASRLEAADSAPPDWLGPESDAWLRFRFEVETTAAAR
ncbi:MAG TPA: hypothetical protein VKP30_08860, partial [Polyangiaceae bacterium]|nr:hypothetical protein [Polyangiaceae bacterium]